MKRGALQLSMDFIVTVIISIALLGLGILLLQQFFTGATELKAEIDQQTEEQLGAELSKGQQISIPYNTQTIRRGSDHIFGIGILNINDPSIFEIQVALGKAFDKNNNELPGPTISNLKIDEWSRYEKEQIRLAKNERHITPLLIQIPKNAPSGTYIFNLKVLSNGQQYDTIKKLYIIVP